MTSLFSLITLVFLEFRAESYAQYGPAWRDDVAKSSIFSKEIEMSSHHYVHLKSCRIANDNT